MKKKKSLLQHHSSKTSIPQCSTFFTVQLSHPYMTTGKTIVLKRLRPTATYFLPKQFDLRLLNNGMGKVTISRLCCHSPREVEVISLPVINLYLSRLIAIPKQNKKIIYKCTKVSKVFYKY